MLSIIWYYITCDCNEKVHFFFYSFDGTVLPMCEYALYLFIFPYLLFALPRDGTTDVTRTVHFGTPSAYEKVFI